MALADITMFDRRGLIVLLVEVKNARETTAEWAIDVRKNTVTENEGFIPRYFLVVARDFCYLWTRPAAADEPPDTIEKTDVAFGSYLQSIVTDARRIASSALELLVGIALQDIANGQIKRHTAWLLESELSKAIAQGRIEFAAAA